jgi:hypothetical protein
MDKEMENQNALIAVWERAYTTFFVLIHTLVSETRSSYCHLTQPEESFSGLLMTNALVYYNQM